MSTEHPLTTPVIPDYELLRLIGRGAYGEVWLARGVTGVYRAIKIVWRDRFPEAGPYEREFRGLREFAAISLSESRQLALLHVGRDRSASYFYYVMELADDAVTGVDIQPERYVPHTLKETRLRRGHLPATECIILGVELARALTTLHTRGLVHRDIKPSNVIMVGGAPKLADIGLVAAASDGLTFVGTEGFVPPEGPGTPAADVFGLGKLLYELLTGLDRHDYPRLPADLHTWPDRKEALELNEVLIRACEPHPSKRHANAAALLDDLLLLQAGRSVRQLRRTERRLSRTLRVATLLAIIAGVAGIGAYLERQRANEALQARLAAEAERDRLAQKTVYSATLAQAQRAIDQDDFARAEKLLDQLIPKPGETDLRGFEWRALRHRARGDVAVSIHTGGPAIGKIFLSSDESLLAAHDSTGTVTLYDAVTQQALRKIQGIADLAGFSSHDHWLVGTDPTFGLQRWAVADGTPEEGSLKGKFRPLTTRGKHGLIAYEESTRSAFLWNFETKQAEQRVALQPADNPFPWLIFRIGPGRSGHHVVIASVRGGGSAAEFQLSAYRPNLDPILVQTAIGRNRPSAVGVDSRGPWAILDISGEVLRVVDDHWKKTDELMPSGTRKYSEFDQESSTGRLATQLRRLVWLDRRTPDGSPQIARGHPATISDIAISSKHQILFSASIDGSLRAWPLKEPAQPTTFQTWNQNAGASGVVFSADGESLCVPIDGQKSVWVDVKSLRVLRDAGPLQYPLKITTEGLIGISAKAGFVTTDLLNGEIKFVSDADLSPIRVATTSDGGKFTAVLDQAGNLRDHDRVVQTGLLRSFYALLSPDGKKLWLTNTSQELTCLSWPDGRELWKQKLSAVAPHFLLSSNQSQLIVALENGTLQIRDAASGAIINQIDSGSAAPQSLTLSPDGSRLFVAGIEGDIHFFATEDWRYLHALPLGSNQRLHILVCSPDGNTLIALTKTGVLHVVRTR